MGRNRLIAKYMGHIMNCITIHGTLYDLYLDTTCDTWDTIPLIPSYMGRDTNLTVIRIVSLNMEHDMTRIVIHGKQYYSYCDTWDTMQLIL